MPLLVPGAPSPTPCSAVRVAAPGRLHLGFLDPSASLGRRFGSLGLVIDGFETVVRLAPASTDEDTAADDACARQLARARAHVDQMRRHAGHAAPLHLHLERVLPAHAGFGSGTQLALAVGRAYADLFGLVLPSAEIARITGRGRRSGIGIAGFDRGGLLLDGGPSADGAPAPLLARLELPAEWRILLALDRRREGLAGDGEKAALARLAPMPREVAAQICHEVLMRVLPGAATGEFSPFAAGVTQVQRILGRHFAPAQTAGAYASAEVGRLIEWIGAHAAAGTGQSSWGPTGFALLPSAESARVLIDAARAAGLVDPALALHVVASRPHGAVVSRWP